MAQRRMLIAGREAACGYPAVVAKLKLTPNQLRQLKEGVAASLVLTESQSKCLDEFLGEKFDFQSVLSVVDPVSESVGDIRKQIENPTPRVAQTFARLFLARSNRLGLSEEQLKKLRELAEEEPKFFDLIQRELSFADVMPVAGAGRGIAPAAVVADQYRGAVESQCWNVLDDKQKSLARQLLGGKR